MSNSQHQRIHQMDHEEVSTIAHSYMIALLHKQSIGFVCEQTGFSRRTVYRWLDEDLPVTSIAMATGAYFILVCETKPAIVDALAGQRRATAYYR